MKVAHETLGLFRELSIEQRKYWRWHTNCQRNDSATNPKNGITNTRPFLALPETLISVFYLSAMQRLHVAFRESNNKVKFPSLVTYAPSLPFFFLSRPFHVYPSLWLDLLLQIYLARRGI